jgi:hypothetical protein
MTKIEKFTQDETKRDWVAKNLPLITEALEALKEDLEVGTINEGLANPVVGNSYLQQTVGINYAIRHMSDLVGVKQPKKNPQPRRQFTEADREFLKEQQEETK